jgi:predicted aspartyl protease
MMSFDDPLYSFGSPADIDRGNNKDWCDNNSLSNAIAPVSELLVSHSLDGAVELDRDGEGHLMFEARINGNGPFSFLIDSGAPRTIVAMSAVLRLGLTTEARELTTNIGRRRFRTTTIHRLEPGSAILVDVPAIVADLPTMAGRIGRDMLRSCSSTLNFRESLLEVGPNAPTSMNGVQPISAPIAVQASVNGINCKAIIDTGATICTANRALASALARRGLTSAALGAPGPARATGLMATVGVGDRLLNGVRLTTTNSVPSGLEPFDHEPALVLGMDLVGTCDRLKIGAFFDELFVSSDAATGSGDIAYGRLR